LANIVGYDAVQPVHALSQDAPLPTQPIGLLWIDGAHDLASVRADVKRFAPLVAPGGHVVIDDYRTWHRGVDAVVDGLRKSPDWVGWAFAPKPLAWATRA
jgi:hypothetical protein